MGYDKEIRIGGTRKTTIGQKVLVRLASSEWFKILDLPLCLVSPFINFFQSLIHCLTKY